MSTAKTIVLVLVALLAFVLELAYGTVLIPFGDVVDILCGGDGTDPSWKVIILDSRLPRALTAIFSGAGLALSGLLMQTLFRNPLADPSVLGISSGASLGVALLIMFSGAGFAVAGFSGHVSIALAAMAGAFMVLALMMAVAERLADNTALLIFGIMLSYFTGAIVSALQFKANSEALRSFVHWGMGSFAETGQAENAVLAGCILVALLLTLFVLPRLNLLLLGEDYAHSMGVNVKRTRLIIIISTGLLVGIVTAYCGPVAFIGLAVPHLARTMMKTSDHSRLILPVIITGSTTCLACDLAARTLALPLNTITSALGAPIVIYIIFRGSRSRAII